MSIGLAIARIALWTGKVDSLQVEIDQEQRSLDAMSKAQLNDPSVTNVAIGRLTSLKFRIGLAKDNVTFWTEELKSVKELLKSFNELAQASR
jgi:hypothetical protein